MEDDRYELYNAALKIAKDAGAVSECEHGLLIDEERSSAAYAAGNHFYDNEYKELFSSRDEMRDTIESVINDAGSCDICV